MLESAKGQVLKDTVGVGVVLVDVIRASVFTNWCLAKLDSYSLETGHRSPPFPDDFISKGWLLDKYIPGLWKIHPRGTEKGFLISSFLKKMPKEEEVEKSIVRFWLKQ